MQVLATVAPTVVEYLPRPQLTQLAVDVVSLYFPATQLQQVVDVKIQSQSDCPATHETCAVATCAREHSRRHASARPAIMRGASNIRKAPPPPPCCLACIVFSFNKLWKSPMYQSWIRMEHQEKVPSFNMHVTDANMHVTVPTCDFAKITCQHQWQILA
jgi:hypothetical protein